MKKFLIGLFITINLTLSGKTYYVSTSGSDSNPGTIDRPFETWEMLSKVMVAGDQAFIRGGTYRSTKGPASVNVCRWESLNGTAQDTIKIWAYPGESPVLNLDNIKMTSNYCYILFIKDCNYLWIKGLRITGLAQTPNRESINGMVINGSSHNLIENCEIDHLGMYGMSFGNGSDYNYIKNCDVHHLADPYTEYGASNGFNRTGGSTANHLTFYGCRAWLCSDDGWDFYHSDGYVTIDNCWAFWNGYIGEPFTKSTGDGVGFKIGAGNTDQTAVTRIVTNSLAVENMKCGFDQNTEDWEGSFASHIYNNFAYKNGNIGFIFSYSSGGDADVFRNNISYKNDASVQFDGDAGDAHDHNSWNGGVTVTDADFKNLDVTQLARPRKADGSLPDIDFLHLSAGSDLINAGINVGLPYGGSAPDLGAFESDIGSYVPPIPVYISSLINNSTPSVVEMTYNLSLANIVPATSAFSVQVNSVARSLNSVAISGTKVLLTLSSPVAYGNTITVAYTKPSSNPLQTPDGGQAASISAQTASNGVNAVVTPPPVVVTPPPVVVTPPPVVVTPPPVVVTPPPVVVTPPVVVPNTPPVAVVNYPSTNYSGFVSELNATGSYDADKDNLSFTWKIPNNISVSATNTPVIEFLAPIVETKQTYDFTLTVSDGKTTQSKTVPVEVLPYQPELETAEVIAVEAVDFQTPYLPYNAVDGNIGTMWSAIGNDKWIILELKELFTIQHVKVAFQPGQKKESYFDVLGSNDKKNWEPVLSKSRSCNFSGDMQVFEFPPSKSEEEYRYIKLIGQGNSLDNWNFISEFRIFGYKHKNPTSYEDLIVKIYPNPASEIVNIIIDDPSFNPDFLNIVGLTGKILHTEKLDPAIRQFQVPVTFRPGIYIVQMGVDEMTMFTQKLIISR